MWPAGIPKNTVSNVKGSDVCPETIKSRSSSSGDENNIVVKPDAVDSLSTPVATAESGNTTISTTNTTKTNIPTTRINTSNTVGMSRRGGSRGILHPVFAPLECTTLATNDEDNEDSEEFNVKVQIRTRESGQRSPLVATPTHRVGVGFNNAWNPYESGRTSPLVASPIVGQKEFPPQLCTPTVPTEPLPPTVVHRALYGKCRFVSFPTLPLYDAPPPPQGSFPLFIGQVRFETTTAELMWLFHRTCGACPLTIEGRGSGCFILHLKSESERALVRQLHKRILFDIGGVWYARSLEEVDSLCEHVAIDGPYLSKQAKLPRDSMVVEDIKVDAAEIPGYYPYYYSQGTQHSQSFTGHPNGWGSSSSTRGTPRGPMYGSKPPSPLMAPLTPTQAPTVMLSSNRASSTTIDFQ